MEFYEFYSAVFKVSLQTIEDGTTGFVDVYSNKFIQLSETEVENIRQNTVSESFKKLYNVEHIIPGYIYNKEDRIFRDLHNSIPSIKILNDYRSNLPINIIPKAENIEYSICERDGKFDVEKGYVPNCSLISQGVKEGAFAFRNKLYANDPNQYRVTGCISKCYFQPMESQYLGLIARAILYFYDKYSDFVKSDKLVEKYMSPEILEIMHNWDLTYEPTEYEINRNFQIFKLQGTSNPFFRTAITRVFRKQAMKNLLTYAPDQVFFQVLNK